MIFLLKLSICLITHLLEFIPALESDGRLFPDPVQIQVHEDATRTLYHGLMILQLSLEYHLSSRKHSCMHLIRLISHLRTRIGHLRFTNGFFSLDLFWDGWLLSDCIILCLLTFNSFYQCDPLLKLFLRGLNIGEKGLRGLDVLIRAQQFVN